MSRHYQGLDDYYNDGRPTPQEVAARQERNTRFLLNYLITILVTLGFVVLLFAGVAVYVALEDLFS